MNKDGKRAKTMVSRTEYQTGDWTPKGSTVM